MAKLWIVYREGLRLLGAPVTDVTIETAIARLDIAPWRMFTARPPEHVSTENVQARPERKRALVEIGEEDRYELCGLAVGFYESPYSPDECMRRLKLSAGSGSAR
jgi:hypothetical protein